MYNRPLNGDSDQWARLARSHLEVDQVLVVYAFLPRASFDSESSG